MIYNNNTEVLVETNENHYNQYLDNTYVNQARSQDLERGGGAILKE